MPKLKPILDKILEEKELFTLEHNTQPSMIHLTHNGINKLRKALADYDYTDPPPVSGDKVLGMTIKIDPFIEGADFRLSGWEPPKIAAQIWEGCGFPGKEIES